MAKSITFPLHLLAVAHQQLLTGSSHGCGNTEDACLFKVGERVLGLKIEEASKKECYDPQQIAHQIIPRSKTAHRVGFIGLGAMGFGMATHLLRSNFTVTDLIDQEKSKYQGFFKRKFKGLDRNSSKKNESPQYSSTIAVLKPQNDAMQSSPDIRSQRSR